MSLSLHAVHPAGREGPRPEVHGSPVLRKEIHLLKHLVRTPARLVLPVILLSIASVVSAQDPQPAEQQQREHIVRRGDTLWDLARAYLENPFLWRLIYEANRDVVEDPHWIYPAERLVIPPLLATEAETPLRDPLGMPVREPLGEPLGTPVGVALIEEPMAPPLEVPELPADTPTVITTVDLRRPVVTVYEYQSTPWVSPNARRQVVGNVLRLADPAAMRDRLASNLHPND